MNIEEIPAGRELDALIEVEVLKRNFQHVLNYMDWFKEPEPKSKIKEPYYSPGCYSSDIEDAWEIINKLSKDFYFSIMEVEPQPRFRFLVSFAQRVGKAWVQHGGDTVPLAICRAALQAVRL